MPRWVVWAAAVAFLTWYVFAEHRPSANQFNAQGV